MYLKMFFYDLCFVILLSALCSIECIMCITLCWITLNTFLHVKQGAAIVYY